MSENSDYQNESETYNRKTWRKTLYSNIGYEDNYTDASFLASLRTNVNQRKVTLQEAFVSAGKVTEQVCLVFAFTLVYKLLVDNLYKPTTVLIQTSFITCLCYFYFLRVSRYKNYDLLINHAKTVVLFFILGYVLSPVLKTLTETISADTIDATTFVMMLVHLIFFDYQVPIAISSRALSLNAAIFGSLCLASRVPSSFHAMVLLTVSVECFVLYPSFVYAVRDGLTLRYLVGLVAVITISVGIVSLQMLAFFLVPTVFINGFCPYLYVKMQNYKHNIYGPWDEAVPIIGQKEN